MNKTKPKASKILLVYKGGTNRLKQFCSLFFIMCLSLFLELSCAQTQRTITDNILITGIRQGPKTDGFYRYQLPSSRTQRAQYIAVTVDPEDAQSDPDIFISKTNPFPNSEALADQTCSKAGSKLCFLRRGYLNPGETIFIGLRCANQCTYSLEVQFIPSVSTLTMNQTSRMTLDGRSLAVFSLPLNSSDTSIDGVQFSVETLSLESPIQLYLSRTSDDLSNIDEEDSDVVIEQGKSIRFTNGDYGWCQSTPCFVFLIVSTRSSPQSVYSITPRSLNRNEVMQNQILFSKVFDFQRGQECLSINVQRSTNDVVFSIKALQGDSELSIIQRNATQNLTILMSELLPTVQVLDSPSRTLILRSFDRARLVLASSVLNLCVNAFSSTSLQINTNQRFFGGRFDLQDDTATSFILDSRDYLYFKFSSFQLSMAQLLTINLQATRLGTSPSVPLNPPRLALKVCQSSLETECSLSEIEAFSNSPTMTQLPGTINSTTQVRTAVINHRPSVCVEPTSCIYLLTVFNPDMITTPMRVTMKLTLSNFDLTPLQLGSRFVNQVNLGQYQYFQVTFTPLQLANQNIGFLNVQLTSFNGRAELYLSTRNRNPQYGMPDVMQASSISFINSLQVRMVRDLTLFIGVFGATQTQFQIRVDPVLTQNSNSSQTALPVLDSTTSSQLSNLSSFILQDRQPFILQMSNPNVTTAQFFYQVPQLNATRQFLNNNLNRTVVLVARVLSQTSSNTSLQMNVSVNQNGQRTQGGNASQFSSFFVFDQALPATQIQFNVSALFNTRSGIRQNATVQVTAYSFTTVPDEVQLRASNLSFFEGFVRRNRTQVFFSNLMDLNSTFRYSLQNVFGNLGFMVEHQSSNFSASQRMRINDDTSFDFASRSFELNEIQEIRVDQRMRESVNPNCRNGAAPLNGGQFACNIYQGIQCLSDFCIFNFSISLSSVNNGRGGRDMPPTLLTTQYRQIGNRNTTNYFYIPFTRTSAQNRTILLSKVNGDSFFFGRVISNAQTPYQTWNYPTLQSNDFIQRSLNISSNELIEISGDDLQLRCPVNTSCALIIGVQGNAALLNQSSWFQITQLTQNNQINSYNGLRGSITSARPSFDYYWFTVNVRPNGQLLSRWNQLILVGNANSTNSTRDFDLYISVFTGKLPTETDFDFKSERNGPDHILIGSDDPLFSNRQQLMQSGPSRILFIVGVRGQGDYTLLNYGPNLPSENFFNSQDLVLGRNQLATFAPRDASFRLFRFLSTNLRDLQLSINLTEGTNARVLLNSVPFKNIGGNSFLNIPLFNATAKQVIQLNRTSQSLRITNSTSSVWCTNCWYYIAVYNGNSTVRANVNVTITEIRDQLMAGITQIKAGDRMRDLIVDNNNSSRNWMARFSLDNRMPFTLNVSTATPNCLLNVTISQQANGMLPLIWNSLNATNILQVRQGDNRFEIGTPYIITINGFSRTNAPRSTFQIAFLQQSPDYTLLKARVTDRMWTPNDLVKYYYLPSPSVYMNYTAFITINTFTPGFSPYIQTLRNDVIMRAQQDGNSQLAGLNLTQNVRFPNFQRFTSIVERPFWQAVNQTSFTFQLPLLQTPMINQQRMPLLNITYQSLAISWINHGFTDVQKCEYEILVRLVPQTMPRLLLNNEEDKEALEKQSLVKSKLLSGLEETHEALDKFMILDQ